MSRDIGPPQDEVMSAVSRINYAVSYAGFEAVSTKPSFNQSMSPCRIQIAKLINKAGNLVSPSIESAQASGNTQIFCSSTLMTDQYTTDPYTSACLLLPHLDNIRPTFRSFLLTPRQLHLDLLNQRRSAQMLPMNIRVQPVDTNRPTT